MAAIAPTTWLGSFLEDWRPGSGAPVADTEPATGIHLASIPQSTPDDVARAAAAAAAAQPAWAETNYQERARVLRRVADLFDAHRAEFGDWTMRETAAVRSKMKHEQNFAYFEALNASTMPSQAYGSLMPSAERGRLSMVRRVPIGVVGAITPWNSPTVLGMRVVAPALALGNAVVLKPDPQTPVTGGVRRGRPPRGPAADRRRRRRRRRSARDGPQRGHGVIHRIDGDGQARGAACRGPLEEGVARARRQQPLRRPRRRRSGRGRVRRGVLVVSAPGPDLHDGRQAPGPPEGGRCLPREAGGQGEATQARRPVPRRRPAWADRLEEAVAPSPLPRQEVLAASASARSPVGPGWPRAARTTASTTARRSWPT